MTLFLPVGPPGCGKSSLAGRMIGNGRLAPTAVVSPDEYRYYLTDDMTDQTASGEAFFIAHRITKYRLERGLHVYFDATNLSLKRLPPSQGQPVVFIWFMLSLPELLHRNSKRDRNVPEDVIARFYDRWLHLDRTDLPGIVVDADDVAYPDGDGYGNDLTNWTKEIQT